MIEIILGSTILGLVVTNVYLFSKMMEMNEKYMKAIIAKNLTQYDESVILDKEYNKKQKPVKQEPVEVGQADESVFNKFIKQVENGQNESAEI